MSKVKSYTPVNHDVTGGRRKQKELVHSIVDTMAYRILGPRMARAVYIEFQIISNLNADGWCEWMDDNIRPREFCVQLRKEQEYPSMILTVVHELVHVRQMARSELYEIYRPKQMQVWRGKRLRKKLPYSKQPWEREAFRLQERYAREYVERSGLRLSGRTWKID